MNRCCICDHFTEKDGPRKMSYDHVKHGYVCIDCYDASYYALMEFGIQEEKESEAYASSSDCCGSKVPPAAKNKSQVAEVPPKQTAAGEPPVCHGCSYEQWSRGCKCWIEWDEDASTLS